MSPKQAPCAMEDGQDLGENFMDLPSSEDVRPSVAASTPQREVAREGGPDIHPDYDHPRDETGRGAGDEMKPPGIGMVVRMWSSSAWRDAYGMRPLRIRHMEK